MGAPTARLVFCSEEKELGRFGCEVRRSTVERGLGRSDCEVGVLHFGRVVGVGTEEIELWRFGCEVGDARARSSHCPVVHHDS